MQVSGLWEATREPEENSHRPKEPTHPGPSCFHRMYFNVRLLYRIWLSKSKRRHTSIVCMYTIVYTCILWQYTLCYSTCGLVERWIQPSNKWLSKRLDIHKNTQDLKHKGTYHRCAHSLNGTELDRKWDTTNAKKEMWSWTSRQRGTLPFTCSNRLCAGVGAELHCFTHDPLTVVQHNHDVMIYNMLTYLVWMNW